MNYLAHLALSHFSADLQVGNYLGDILRGREVATLPPEIRRGVFLHREIDRLTDANKDVKAVNRLLSGRHGRYAPVLSDIAFDHFLCLNWQKLMPTAFAPFCQHTYAVLRAGKPHMPVRAARYVDGMTSDNWLALYTTPAGMRRVFARLRPRLSRPELLTGIDDSLRDFAPVLNRALLLLFPRLQALAETYREPRT